MRSDQANRNKTQIVKHLPVLHTAFKSDYKKYEKSKFQIKKLKNYHINGLQYHKN